MQENRPNGNQKLYILGTGLMNQMKLLCAVKEQSPPEFYIVSSHMRAVAIRISCGASIAGMVRFSSRATSRATQVSWGWSRSPPGWIQAQSNVGVDTREPTAKINSLTPFTLTRSGCASLCSQRKIAKTPCKFSFDDLFHQSIERRVTRYGQQCFSQRAAKSDCCCFDEPATLRHLDVCVRVVRHKLESIVARFNGQGKHTQHPPFVVIKLHGSGGTVNLNRCHSEMAFTFTTFDQFRHAIFRANRGLGRSALYGTRGGLVSNFFYALDR
uniref:Uncharacterized protein n=1 Tax=Pseudictyota dubia TaxID=2749911 RepID=A0A7R9W2B9_9STRA|mmetsp:Transcript_29140/g.53999  ORF Transcript_29140/g.53999 Transcript_29140/m.53999 type:complete len:270 (+) Transcript_29140:21-830(+)